jgi:hypothetical protein
MADSTHDVALYYPYINFRDERWLKLAVLYWDVIHRITASQADRLDPPMYWTSQPNDMRELEHAGVVRPYVPVVEQAPQNALWRDFIAHHGDDLAKRYALDLDAREELPDTSTDASGYLAPARRKRGVGWLLAGKMDQELFDDFVDAGLARDGSEVNAPGWRAFDERVLDAYMTTLANEVFAAQHVETVTDVPGHFRRFKENSEAALVEALLSGSPAASSLASSSDGLVAMTLAVEAVSPAGIEGFSMGAILGLRRDSRDARRAFKLGTAALVKQIAERRAKSPGGVLDPRDLAELREQHIDEPLKELKRAFATSHGQAVMSVLTLQNPLAAGTVGASVATAAGLGNPIIGAVGIALGMFQIFTGAKQKRKELAKSPLAWLLDVEAKVDAKQALDAVV